MGICIYNSLTKKKEELIPLNGNKINIYSCGVTVYDKCHIGHARSLYLFDVITRYLKFKGYDVKFARNITDVDDKIINKARELNKSFKEVVICLPSNPKRMWIPGDWISVSTTPTRWPCDARTAATFAVVLDFPVPPRKE